MRRSPSRLVVVVFVGQDVLLERGEVVVLEAVAKMGVTGGGGGLFAPTTDLK